MRLLRLWSILNEEPLLCSDVYRSTVMNLLGQHAELSRDEFRATRTGIPTSGEELDIDQAEVRDGVAIIPIGGPIGMNLGEKIKGMGAVDVDDIQAEIADAEQNDEVMATVLFIDSPGGMVMGTPELADFIANCQKPIFAYTRGHMCSAAYYLACACDGVFASPSAAVGNIGVSITVNDISRMTDMAGVKVKVFASGTYKGAGTSGTTLTAQQEVEIQKNVMTLANQFYSHVKANRADVEDSDMQGQVFRGEDAIVHGFVDDNCSSLEELIENIPDLIELLA